MQNPLSPCVGGYVIIRTHSQFLSLSHTFKLVKPLLSLSLMEIFWELTFTIAVSLLLPLVFIKLLSSVTPNFETNLKVAVTGRDHDCGVKSDSQNWETEDVVRIVGEIDEFRDESVLEKLIAAEIVDVNSEKIDENNEIEVMDLAENPAEETSQVNEVEAKEVEISQCDEYKRNVEVGEDMGLLDEDDWEGIESSELEKCFGEAVVFVGNANGVGDLSNDVKMKLYGYHRIATQGPCSEPQPMALNFSARAKWNAWQQLGIMSPELAMERYISLLSETIPDWMANYTDENVQLASADTRAFAKLT